MNRNPHTIDRLAIETRGSTFPTHCFSGMVPQAQHDTDAEATGALGTSQAMRLTAGNDD